MSEVVLTLAALLETLQAMEQHLAEVEKERDVAQAKVAELIETAKWHLAHIVNLEGRLAEAEEERDAARGNSARGFRRSRLFGSPALPPDHQTKENE